MPLNLAPAGSLNLDEKKAQKKAEEEKKKKSRFSYFLLSFSLLALGGYSVVFFYPHLMAYLKAPSELRTLAQEIEATNTSLITLQKEKSLHQSGYNEENQRKTAILDVVFPFYEKLRIIRDIETAANTLSLLGTFEMNSITVAAPVPEAVGWVTRVSGNFRASKSAFDAFIQDYVGNSGNLEDSNATLLKEIEQISIRPTELKSVRAGTAQATTEPGYAISFKLAFYTRPPQEKEPNSKSQIPMAK